MSHTPRSTCKVEVSAAITGWFPSWEKGSSGGLICGERSIIAKNVRFSNELIRFLYKGQKRKMSFGFFVPQHSSTREMDSEAMEEKVFLIWYETSNILGTRQGVRCSL